MLEDLKHVNKVVGIKQSEKAVASGAADYVYIADDAHERVTEPFKALCAEYGVSVRSAESMARLGSACGIDVGAAVVAILK